MAETLPALLTKNFTSVESTAQMALHYAYIPTISMYKNQFRPGQPAGGSGIKPVCYLRW